MTTEYSSVHSNVIIELGITKITNCIKLIQIFFIVKRILVIGIEQLTT